MKGSKRYKAELKKLRKKPVKEEKKMPEFNQFNIEPGMSTWVDSSPEYKKAYYEWIENEKVARARRHESTIKRRIDDQKWEVYLNKPGKDAGERKIKKRSMTADFMGNSVSNFIDNKFFERRRAEMRPASFPKKRKKILLISDVSGWAWWNKSKYLQMYLADEFDIDVVCMVGHDAKPGIDAGKYDLYFTYGYSYVSYIGNVKLEKRVTGVTAHRPKKVIKSFMMQAWYLHANSILLLSELKKIINHNRIYYVPNGVDESLFKPIDPIGERDLLVAGHVGKECPQKMQTAIIQPAINQAQIESFYNLNDYTTRVPYCEMYKQYQEMDVFVVASIEDGTPNGALEAAACGRPIISNRIGNMPEFIKDGYNGFLVDMNVQSYVDKLKYLNEHRDKLKEMGKNARKTVEEGWTWKIQAENYRKMFKDILGK